MLPTFYKLDEGEHKSLIEFEKHECRVPKDTPMGVRIFVRFAITKLGVLAQAQCSCGAQKGITNPENLE